MISNGKSYCCSDILLMSGLYRCLQRMFKKNTNYFYAVKSAFHYLFLSEIFIQLLTFSKSYARKRKWMFFF